MEPPISSKCKAPARRRNGLEPGTHMKAAETYLDGDLSTQRQTPLSREIRVQGEYHTSLNQLSINGWKRDAILNWKTRVY